MSEYKELPLNLINGQILILQFRLDNNFLNTTHLLKQCCELGMVKYKKNGEFTKSFSRWYCNQESKQIVNYLLHKLKYNSINDLKKQQFGGNIRDLIIDRNLYLHPDLAVEYI